MYYTFSPFAGIGSVLYSIFVYLISNAVLVLELVGMWFMFRKMQLPGWKGIIPFYSTYVLFEKLWEKKLFWRVIIYIAICFGASLIGSLLMVFGGLSTSNEAAAIILFILGASFLIASIVFAVLAIVIEFKLFVKLAHAFGLKTGWAWGMLFVPFVMFPIIGFNKKIVYYGPVNQV